MAHYHLQQQHQIFHQINLYVLIPQQDASAAESERAANDFWWFGGVVISSVYNIWIYPLTNCGILCRNNISISARHALSSHHTSYTQKLERLHKLVKEGIFLLPLSLERIIKWIILVGWVSKLDLQHQDRFGVTKYQLNIFSSDKK